MQQLSVNIEKVKRAQKRKLITPKSLLELERKWILEPFEPLFYPSRFKVFWGGRAGCKTFEIATALVLLMCKSPIRVLCVREIQESISESVKAEVDLAIERMGLGAYFTSLKTEIRCYSGAVMFFKGLHTEEQQNGLKSTVGIDICWVEEASSISVSSWKILTPTIRKEGSEIWVSFNPHKEDDVVYETFVGTDDPPPDSIVVQTSFRDNPRMPQFLIDEMQWQKGRSLEAYLHIWEGHTLKRSEAAIFPNCTEMEFDEPEPGTVLMRYGADWGFSTDPTVLVRFWVDDPNRRIYIIHEAHRIGCPIHETPALFRKVPGSERALIVADSARPETIYEMQRQKFNVIPAKKGPGSVEEGIKFLQDYDIVIHPRCVNALRDFNLYQYKVDRKTEIITDIPVDKDNHFPDAVRYGSEDAIFKRSGGRRSGIKVY